MAEQTTIASFFVAAEASISVLLTAAYGYVTARIKYMDGNTAKQMSNICTRVLLPAMMIVEMGNQMKDLHTLLHYLPIILWGVVSTLIAYLLSLLCENIFNIPQWAKLGVCFPNALKESTIIKQLVWGPNDTVSAAVRRGRTYILINSLVANIMRFSLGPAMLQKRQTNSDEEDVIPSHEVADEGTALLPTPPIQTRVTRSLKSLPKNTWKAIYSIWNPPLTGAILAVFIGLIPAVKREFYDKEGFFYGTITTSLSNIGELFTALMLFVLGANLQIKTSQEASTPTRVLIYIYVMRFILLPVISIVIIWKICDWGWLNDTAHEGLGGDPMMKFIMCLIPAGPPAIVLANIAELAGVAQGQVGKLLILSYVVSPTVAFTVAASLYMITNLG